MNTYPLSDVQIPVAIAELAQYLAVDADDPILPGLALSATDTIITHLERDLVPRRWRMVVKEVPPQNPQLHTTYRNALNWSHYPGLRTVTAFPGWVDLPFGALEVHSVIDENGKHLEYKEDLDSRPGRIFVETFDRFTVEYTAGFEHVPEAILEAVKALAAFMYEHRGHCEAQEALHRSGAAQMIKRWRIERL